MDTGKTIALIKAFGGSGGGGGSGLPAVTGADIGKSMVVQRGAASAGAVIVPQQTVSDEGAGTYPLSNVVTDLFTAGRPVQVTYGEETEIGYIYADGPDIYCDLEGGSLGYSSDAGGWYFWLASEPYPPASLTISANEVNFAADWDKAYPYDMGIEIDITDYDDPSGEIVFGTFAEVMAKLNEGKPVSISVSSGPVRYNPVCVSYEDGVISVAIINPYPNPIKLIWMNIQSDGTITITIPT